MNTTGERGTIRSGASNGEDGFIGIILLVILALAGLKYFFDFSIFEFLDSDKGRDVLAYVIIILHWLKDQVLALWGYIH